LRGACVHVRGGATPASIYRNQEGQDEILGLYDEALSHLGIGPESETVSTRYGETHVLSLGSEDSPPVVCLHGGNVLNPTCLRWFLPIAHQYRIYAPDIVGQPVKSAQGRPPSACLRRSWSLQRASLRDRSDGCCSRRVST
jgi:pimeloyl-ACP methyl ester carboxylesterase